MALKVIGAGWGRTGTESLKHALEQLGFGKCYHMVELFKDGRKVMYWEQLHQGSTPDYEDLFHGYQSAVDLPTFLYYKELMKVYPEAKVILTVRDADKWYESASKTIFRKPPGLAFILTKFLGLFSAKFRYFSRIFKYAETAALQGLIKGKVQDKEFVKSIFNDWNEEVKKSVSAERLLVFEVKDGWEPLCTFLHVPVPAIPFPKSNESDTFQKRLKTKNIIRELGKTK